MLVEYIKEKFPIKTILRIVGDPTYKAINELREAMYANAAAIPTTIGGGVQWSHWPTHGRRSLC